MYYFFSLLTGILISVMIAFNGGLAELYGVYTSTVIIHIVGLVLIAALMLVKRERPFSKRQSWFLYLGGAIGVMTTVFNNLSFGRISISAILALGLFGQSIIGLIIDQYGWLGMPKHPYHKQKIIGLVLILGGIAPMINSFDTVAVLASLAAGAVIVVVRTLGAKLAEFTNIHISTFFNYLVGFVLTIPVFLLLGNNESGFANIVISPDWYVYLGGVLGVCVVLLSNMTVAKISAFYLSLLLFIGQIFAGVLIDALISRSFSPQNLIGGVLVTTGLCVNLLFDRVRMKNRS